MPEAVAAESVADAVNRGTARLAEAGCDTPRLDTELLLARARGVERGRLVIDSAAELGRAESARFEQLLRRRSAREPIAYILGRKGFRRISLLVDRHVLIPRPETELLVEIGLSLPPGARVVDVGAGSGAIALALKDERPDLDVWATEVSRGALAVARRNAAELGLQVEFVHADLLEGVGGRFDAVLANLPYVAVGDLLQPEIALYEPPAALFAGPDGLDEIRRLVEAVSEVPLVALEVGSGQAAAVGDLLSRSGFRSVERMRDLAGHERVVVGRR